MKIWVDEDEFWPWYNVHRASGDLRKEIDVPAKTVRRWEKILAAAEQAQEEIKSIARAR